VVDGARDELDARLGEDERLARQETARDGPEERREPPDGRVGPTRAPPLDVTLDDLAHLALTAAPRVARRLDLADEALALVRVDDAPSAAAVHHGVEPAAVLAALVRDARHAHLVHDAARPPQQDRDDLEPDEEGDPAAAAPEVLEERQRQVGLGVDAVGADLLVREDDDADDADDDDGRPGDVQSRDRDAGEEKGEQDVEDEARRAERRDVLGPQELEREGRPYDLRGSTTR